MGRFHGRMDPVRSNTLGLWLVRGSVDGLTQIDNLGTFPEDIALGLLFVEA